MQWQKFIDLHFGQNKDSNSTYAQEDNGSDKDTFYILVLLKLINTTLGSDLLMVLLEVVETLQKGINFLLLLKFHLLFILKLFYCLR